MLHSLDESLDILSDRIAEVRRKADDDGLDLRAFASATLGAAVVDFKDLGVSLDKFVEMARAAWGKGVARVSARAD